MKLKVLLLILLIVSSFNLPLIPIPLVSAEPSYIVEGDVVYIDDENAYIAVYPHTTSGGWVYLNLTSKVYTGEVDVVFGFDTDVSQPRRLEWYNPHEEQVERNYTIPDYYFTNTTFYKYNYSFMSQYPTWLYYGEVWLWHNETQWNSTYPLPGWVLDWSHEFTRANKDTHVVYWFDTIHVTWVDIAKRLDWEIIYYERGGMDRWYHARFTVEALKSYHTRMWLDVIPQLDGRKAKYWVAFKPASETLSDAISLGHLYALDPWYNPDWDYRKSLTIGSGDVDEALTDFPVLVYLNSSRIDWTHVQDDLDDLRFTNADNSTVLKYEIEKYTTNDKAWVWVKVDSISNTSDTSFYMYYGNIDATSGEDAENVWDSNFKLVTHMKNDPDTTHVRDSTSSGEGDLTKKSATEPEEVDSKIGKGQKYLRADGIDGKLIGASGVASRPDNGTWEIWVKRTTVVDALNVYFNDVYDVGTDYSSMLWQPVAQNRINFYHKKAGSYYRVTCALTYIPANEWVYVVWVWQNGQPMKMYFNASEPTYILQDNPPSTMSSGTRYVGNNWGLDNEHDGILDEVRVSNTNRAPAWIKASYETQRDHLLDYGSEETAEAPEYDYVDLDTSNVDGVMDNGTHSNFTTQKYCDSIYDTLTEVDTGSQSSENNVDSEIVTHGSTTGISGAQTTDGTTENMTEASATPPSLASFTSNEGNGVTSISVNKPSGTSSGDLLIVFCSIDATGAAITGPSGFTILFAEDQKQSITAASWYREADGTEGASFSCSWSGTEDVVIGCFRITGWDSADFPHKSAKNDGTGQTIFPAVTTTKDDCLLVRFFGMDDDDDTEPIEGCPSGHTEMYALATTSLYGEHTGAACHRDWASAGDTGTATWAHTSGEGWCSYTVAIAPTAAANYQLDIEHVVNSIVNYQNYNLTTKAYRSAENFYLQMYNFTASAWKNMSTISAGSLTWYNTTIAKTDFVNGTNHARIRYWQGVDATQEKLFVDYSGVYGWNATNYRLDLEIQWENANYTRTNEQLCIKTGDGGWGAEDIKVYAWNVSTSDWHLVFDDLSASQWNNVSVTDWLNNETFTVRFLDGTQIGDGNQDSWYVDCSLLHTWEAGELYPKEVDQIASVNSFPARIGMFNRPSNQPLTFIGSTTKIAYLLYDILQNIGLSTLPSRIHITVKEIPQILSMSLSTERILTLVKGISQPLSILSSTSRFYKKLKTISQPLQISTSTSRFAKYIMQSIQGINIFTSVERIRSFVKTIAQPLSALTDTSRVYYGMMEINQKINIPQSISRVLSKFMELNQDLTISSIPQRVYYAFRQIHQPIPIQVSVSALRQFFMNLYQSLSMMATPSRFYGGVFDISTKLNIATSVSRLYTRIKEVSQAINVQTSVLRGLYFTKQIGEVVNIATDTSRIFTILRNLAQKLTPSAIPSRFYEAIANMPQTLTVKGSVEAWKAFYKTISQHLNIHAFTARIYTGVRGVNQQLEIELAISRFRKSIVAVNQVANIQTAVLKGLYLTKQVSQNIGVITDTSRIFTIMKTVAQQLSISTISSRFYEAIVSMPQALTVQTSVEATKALLKEINQLLNVKTSLTRAYTGVIQLNQLLDISSATSRFYKGIFKIPQSLTFTLSTTGQKVLANIRKIAQILAVSDAISKQALFIRTSTQDMPIYAVASGFRIFVTSIHQIIEISLTAVRQHLIVNMINQIITLNTKLIAWLPAAPTPTPLRGLVLGFMFGGIALFIFVFILFRGEE